MSEAISPGAFKKSIDDDLEITLSRKRYSPPPIPRAVINAFARSDVPVWPQHTTRPRQTYVRPRSTQTRAPQGRNGLSRARQGCSALPDKQAWLFGNNIGTTAKPTAVGRHNHAPRESRICPTVHADCRQDREGQGPNKLLDTACTWAAIALQLSGAYEASCVDRVGLGLVRGQGTKAAALHCCTALFPFGQFAPLPSDVQIHLPKCGVRRCTILPVHSFSPNG